MDPHDHHPSDAMAEDSSCRICLESDTVDNLCQPCACRGTQAWVHPACLRRWQKTRDTDTRKNICPVCRHVYLAEFIDSPPASPSRHATPPDDAAQGVLGLSLWAWALLAGASIGFFALLPAPFAAAALALLSASLLGLQRILEGLLRVVGVRLAFVVDTEGIPFLRVVRIGSHIHGLAAGALLVATERIGGGIFARSVLVITQHNASGTMGYILNLPYDFINDLGHARHVGGDEGAPLRHALAAPDAPEGTVQHGLGGPVDLDGWAAILHTYAHIPGATPLLGVPAPQPPPNATPTAEPPPRVRVPPPDGVDLPAAVLNELPAGTRPAPRSPPVFVGGDMAALRLAVEGERGGGGGGGGGGHEPRHGGVCRLKALYGHAAWAPGQLEGEIRAKGTRAVHATHAACLCRGRTGSESCALTLLLPIPCLCPRVVAAWTWAADLGPAFAMTVMMRPPDHMWNLAKAAVETARRVGRPAGA